MKQILLYLFLLGATGIWAQNGDSTYVRLADITGFDRDRYQVELEAAAQDLLSAFNLEPFTSFKDQFKIFDFGFYLHHTKMKDGVPEAFEQAKALAARQAPYYLLIGKESNELGIFQRFLVSLKLPDESEFPCFNQSRRRMIESAAAKEMNEVHSQNKKIPYKYVEAEKAGMATVKGFLEKYITCCPYPSGRSTSQCKCEGLDTLTLVLENKGMLYFDVDRAEAIGQDYPTIDSKVNVVLQNNGYTWNLTDDLEVLAAQMGANKDSIRVRFIKDDPLSCLKLWEYIDGKEPPATATLRNNDPTPFSHEVIVIQKEGVNRVFFRFSESEEKEILDKWALKVVGMAKSSGLYYMAANLFFEKCLRDKDTYQQARSASDVSSLAWTKTALSKTDEDYEIVTSGLFLIGALSDFLLASTSSFTFIDIDGFGNIAESKISEYLGERSNSWLKLIDDRNLNTSTKREEYYIRCSKCLGVEVKIIAGKFQYEGNVYYEGDKGNFTCITPSGHLFNLPKGAKAAFNVILQEEPFDKWPLGSLVGFKIGQEEYEGRWYSNSGHFLGYALDGVTAEEPIYATESVYKNTNKFEVYAARVIECNAEILRGGYATESFLRLNPTPNRDELESNPLVISALSIGSFIPIEEDTFYSKRCLGDTAWCKAIFSPPGRTLHPYLEEADQTVIGRIVKQNPCLLADLEHLGFTPYQIETEWMKAVKDLVAMGTAYAFTPIVVEQLLAKFLQEYGKDKIKDAVIAYYLDLLFQACIKYYFPPDGQEISWDEAFQDLDKSQALFSASEALISLENPYAELAVTSATSCIFDGFTEKGELRDGFSFKDCAIGVGFNALIQGVIRGAPFIKEKLKSIPKPIFIKGLIRFFGDLQPGLHLNGPNLPVDIKIKIYKWIYGDELKADDIEVIFDITSAYSKEIAEKLNQNASFRLSILFTDLWTYIRTVIPNVSDREKIIKDLIDEIGAAGYIRSMPNGLSPTQVFDQILAAGSVKKWMDDIIDTGQRNGEPSLAKILEDFSFPNAGKAVKNAGNVNTNNTKGLDSGDPRIPNLFGDYTFFRNGKTYSKGQSPHENETWKEYFTRLKNSGDFNEFQSHHIFPVNLFKRSSFRKWYELVGKDHFSINGEKDLKNLIMLEQFANNIGVHSKHDAYTNRIGDYFENQWGIYKANGQNWSEERIAFEIDKDIKHLVETLKQSILNNSVIGDLKINDYWNPGNVNFESLIR